MPLIEQIYVRTENGIYDVTYWTKDDKGYYTYFTDDWCEPKQYIYNDDIIKTADNLEDLIDQYWYKIGDERKRCFYSKEMNRIEYLTDEELKERHLKTVKGYIWVGDDLICVAEMKEYGDSYKLFLKERE